MVLLERSDDGDDGEEGGGNEIWHMQKGVGMEIVMGLDEIVMVMVMVGQYKAMVWNERMAEGEIGAGD